MGREGHRVGVDTPENWIAVFFGCSFLFKMRDFSYYHGGRQLCQTSVLLG